MFENRNKMFILSLKSNFNLIIVRPKKNNVCFRSTKKNRSTKSGNLSPFPCLFPTSTIDSVSCFNFLHFLVLCSTGFYDTTVVNVYPEIKKNGYIPCGYLIQHSIDWFSELPRYHRNLLFLTYKMDAVVIADYRLVNILWLKIMHWIWRKGSLK
jgi:hypothetical protein